MGNAGGYVALLSFKLSHARFHGRLIQSVLDGGHDPGNGPADLLQRTTIAFSLHTLLPVLAIDMLGIGGNGGLHLVGRHKPFGKARKCPLVQHFTANGPVVGADVAAMMVQTTIAPFDRHADLTAAQAAFDKAREQMDRLCGLPSDPSADS